MSESEDFSEQLKHESCSSYYIHRIMVSHWQRLQNGIHSVVTYFFFEAFITICTAIYAIFLSTEHHGMSKVHEQVVDVSGYVSMHLLVDNLHVEGQSDNTMMCAVNLLNYFMHLSLSGRFDNHPSKMGSVFSLPCNIDFHILTVIVKIGVYKLSWPKIG